MTEIQIGRIGETYVLYKLATMMIYAMKVSEHFDFDLLTVKGTRIEVKTARKGIGIRKYKNHTNKWDVWSFNNAKIFSVQREDKSVYRKYKKVDRRCDFFVCVCLNDDYTIKESYIVPKEAVGTKTSISIGMTKRGKHKKWLERWDLIK